MNDPRIAAAFAVLPDYLGGHIRVSLAALALGLAVSLPLALAIRNRPLARAIALGLASVVQTVPGLALLALFYPLLLALAAVSAQAFGASFSAFGFLPAMLALALYAMLPVLRNTVTGLAGIDPQLREAAEGVGMTPRQVLIQVELPLALPVMMAGIRTAAVWVIGTATLATPIGQTSLGNYIFAGLQTQNWVLVLAGCIAAALLALAVDQALAAVETGLRRSSRPRIAAGLVAFALIVATGLAPGFATARATYRIGAKTFTEQYVLADVLAARLRAAGLTAATREGLGSSVIYAALKAGEIDAYVDYTGTLWANQFKRGNPLDRAALADMLGKDGVTLLGDLGFANAYVLAMPRVKAEAAGIRSIADLASHAAVLTIAGDYEFFSRPEWTALRDAYGLAFKAQRTMQPDFMYAAAASGEADVIAGYSSDGPMAKYDLVALDDPKRAIPPYDAAILLAPGRRDDAALRDALTPLVGAVSLEAMRAANLRAASGSAAEAAAWLGGQVGK